MSNAIAANAKTDFSAPEWYSRQAVIELPGVYGTDPNDFRFVAPAGHKRELLELVGLFNGLMERTPEKWRIAIWNYFRWRALQDGVAVIIDSEDASHPHSLARFDDAPAHEMFREFVTCVFHLAGTHFDNIFVDHDTFTQLLPDDFEAYLADPAKYETFFKFVDLHCEHWQQLRNLFRPEGKHPAPLPAPEVSVPVYLNVWDDFSGQVYADPASARRAALDNCTYPAVPALVQFLDLKRAFPPEAPCFQNRVTFTPEMQKHIETAFNQAVRFHQAMCESYGHAREAIAGYFYKPAFLGDAFIVVPFTQALFDYALQNFANLSDARISWPCVPPRYTGATWPDELRKWLVSFGDLVVVDKDEM